MARRFWKLPRILIAILAVITLMVWIRTRWWRLVIGYPSEPAQWLSLEQGLDYRKVIHAGITVHAVRIDLHRFDLRVADARSPSRVTAEVATLATEQHGLVAVNGTFFEKDLRPLGQIVDRGQQLNPPDSRSWFATLAVFDGLNGPNAELRGPGVPLTDLTLVRFAVQVGPRTVIGGEPVTLSSRESERTGACVVTPTTVILFATENAFVGEDWMAGLMARPEADGGFSCRDGMLFDGGPSTQLAIRTPALHLDVVGGWPVPNAVMVVRRTP